MRVLVIFCPRLLVSERGSPLVSMGENKLKVNQKTWSAAQALMRCLAEAFSPCNYDHGHNSDASLEAVNPCVQPMLQIMTDAVCMCQANCEATNAGLRQQPEHHTEV